MNNSKIDVNVIDDTLLYVCINGKREHISLEHARIKYGNNTEVMSLINSAMDKYYENSKPLEPRSTEASVEPTKEDSTSDIDIDSVEIDLSSLNGAPLEAPRPSERTSTPSRASEPSLPDLNSRPLEAPSTPTPPAPESDRKTDPKLEDLNNSPLAMVDEAKFAQIYGKYNSRIRETFPTDSPSFLDVEKLTRNDKPLEPR